MLQTLHSLLTLSSNKEGIDQPGQGKGLGLEEKTRRKKELQAISGATAERSSDDEIEEEVEEQDEKEEDDDQWDIYVTGHSLGGALATLCAFDIGRAINTPCQHTLSTHPNLTHPINIHTITTDLSTALNIPLHDPSTHPINPPYQHTLSTDPSTHPVNHVHQHIHQYIYQQPYQHIYH